MAPPIAPPIATPRVAKNQYQITALITIPTVNPKSQLHNCPYVVSRLPNTNY